jgi:hypothetical protein
MKIEKTTKYDIFKVVNGNRALNRGHIKNLAVSVMRNNLLEFNPIIVNKKMEVIDGQHRLEVAKNNGLPIYYVISETSTLNDVQSLNSAQKVWCMQDYIDSFIEQGNDNYVVLDLFIKTYELPVSTCVSLLGGHNGGRESFAMLQFKRGEFIVTSMKTAEEYAHKINDVRTFCEKSIGRNTFLTRAVITINKKNRTNPNFAHETLVRKLSICGKKIPRYASEKEYLRFLEDAYNFKTKGTDVRLF